MSCVVVEEIVFIRDIPLELLAEAIEAGELRKGKLVGLRVTPEEGGETTLVELKLREDGQEQLIVPGRRFPVVQAGDVLIPREDWRTYLQDVTCSARLQP